MSQLTPTQIGYLEDARHKSKQYLAVVVPDDVITAEVTGAQTRGETVIPYDTVSGTEADVLADMTVWFGSTAGARDIGTARAKSIDAVGNELTIEENDLDLSDNDHITVKRVWELRAKLQAIDTSGSTVVFTKDGVTWTDETKYIPPTVNMGPAFAEFIDAALGYATVYFVDEYSASLVSASLDTKTWDYDGGAVQGGSGTAADPYEVRYAAAGTYWVSLTITDSNSATSVGYRPVLIFDSNNTPYYDYSTSGKSLSVEGTSQAFTVFGTADQTEFPDGAMVIRFNQDYYGGTERTIECRYPKRGDVKYVGYIRGETIETDTNLQTVSFETIGITRAMDEIPGFGDSLTDAAVPTSWTEMYELDVIKAVHHLLMTQSTALTVTDFRWSLPHTQAQMRAQRVRWGKASIHQQGQLPLESVFSHLSATSQGLLEIRMTPHVMGPGDRAGNITTVVDLDNTHFGDVSITREPYHRAESVRTTGIGWDGSTATPLGARAPGVPDVIARPNNEDVSGLVVIDQAETNQLAGDYLAMVNNLYPEATVVLPGNWDVFEPALKERVTLTLAAVDNNRGLTFDTDDDWVVERVNVAENPGGGFVGPVTLTLSYETTGNPGVAITIGDQPTWPVPAEPGSEGEESGSYAGGIIGSYQAGVIYSPDDVFDTAPVWGDLQSDELPASGSKEIYLLSQVQDGVSETLWAMTYCGFYEVSLPPGSGPWVARIRNYEIAALAGVAAEEYAMFDMKWSAHSAGHAWAVLRTWKLPTLSLVVCHTHDGWKTLEWSNVVVQRVGDARIGRAQIGIANDGTDLNLYLSFHWGGVGCGSWGVKKSLDGGVTWANSYYNEDSCAQQPYTSLYCPHSNPNYVYAVIGEGRHEMVYTTDAGATWSTPIDIGCSLSYPNGLSGDPHDETILTVWDIHGPCAEWNGTDFDAWGLQYNWWTGGGQPDQWGGWCRGIRVLERNSSGGLVKVLMAGLDKVNDGKVLLMEAADRTLLTENWADVAGSTVWALCVANPPTREPL